MDPGKLSSGFEQRRAAEKWPGRLFVGEKSETLARFGAG
jgi:hypothetical protein